MKTFVIIINELGRKHLNSELSFMEFIDDNLFEWWKYSADTYFVATPDSFTAEGLEEKIVGIFPHAISAVIEVNLKKWSGFGPNRQCEGNSVSFMYWFTKITDEKFVPAWESKLTTNHFKMQNFLLGTKE